MISLVSILISMNSKLNFDIYDLLCLYFDIYKAINIKIQTKETVIFSCLNEISMAMLCIL